jgi:energy-converting hydrogenase A subunit M
MNYSFPYNLHYKCALCKHLHTDLEDEKIKRWCTKKDCDIYLTFYGDVEENGSINNKKKSNS